ncbi:hypothetical protein Cni_G21839 [Canna indica]|uniref:Transmembrane protein n=1 Tax=Canna indica TaxID=4628 RepID=A0AAQ3KRM0_9LILI|nr:hypothetical protein Cni_G21839 [Canna indica]
MESGERKKMPNVAAAEKTAETNDDRTMPASASACLLLIILLGIGLLVWWSVVFHPDNERLWMVPLSLVMVGTPLIVCLSVYCSCTTSSVVDIPDPDPEK